MKKEFRDFRANDTRAKVGTTGSKKAIAEANDSFRLARFHMKEGRLKLAGARLTFESPEQVEQDFRQKDESIEASADPEFEEVLAELTSLGGNDCEVASMRDPAYLEIFTSELREQERLGLLYSSTVEILFPPQITAEYGPNGVILNTREVLLWLAKDLETELPDRATMYREIADQYYPDDEDDWDDGDDEDGDEDYDEAA